MTSKFTGNVLPIFLFCLWAPVLSIITFGLATPFIICTVTRWVCNNSTISGKKCVFTGTAPGLFGLWLVGSILTIITVGIYGFWAARNQIRWIVENTKMAN